MEQILSVFLGIIASWIQGRTSMSGDLKFVLSLIAASLAGFTVTAFNLYVNKEYNPEMLLANIGMAFTASQTYYQTYLKKK